MCSRSRTDQRAYGSLWLLGLVNSDSWCDLENEDVVLTPYGPSFVTTKSS